MAADVTSAITVYRQETGPGGTQARTATDPNAFKEIIVTCPATADDTDTFKITLSEYGITTFKTIRGWTHSTDFSVVITEDPTTSVTAGVLTVTIGGATDNKLRAFLIGGI